tara:strand:- start:512 stop:733 length:222 start_codon:yes stop_codon:yes gene_type:complete
MNKQIEKNIWIDKNYNDITNILNIIFDELNKNKNKNKYNYIINNTIIEKLVYYIYDNSDNKYIDNKYINNIFI